MKKILLICICLLFYFLSFSQNKTGAGNVSDQAGVLIPNAIVQFVPASDTSLVYEFICDKNGNYSFSIPSAETVFFLNIFSSFQTLQFYFVQETITLAVGYNGMFFHNVETTGTPGIRFTIVDTNGNPVAGAEVKLYDSKGKWRTDSCSIAKPVYSDLNGQAEINSLLPVQYWFNVKKGYLTNRFTIFNTGSAIDTSALTLITDTIRDLSQKEVFMCGTCDNKTWITDSMIIFGITQPYDADSKLISDGTWYDSNGNHGFWWFNADETKMTYDYDSNSTNGGGSTVEATLIELTDSNFSGDMTILGLPVTYFMSAQYDTIDLQLSVQDTVLFLNGTGVASLSPDDLSMNAAYCFTCQYTLSQSGFTVNDTGVVPVVVTMEDRCGNSVSDTIEVTIAKLPPLLVNKISVQDFRMYPNPGGEVVNIESTEKISAIAVSDLMGIGIKQFQVNENRFSLNTPGLHGIFLIKIYTERGVVTKKLVID